ncbi:ATP-binding protein [Nostoc sp. 'Peltigera membranacea cyanobiont' 232]|uniref:ATP-binding protein n=1 Tax=Nostoc sp. 'Peltigera membranacea cyanobiont' 232 TaxID=2014531 RepID=UPI001676A01E|nr:ATP-binding protein [Nostoc sp. 'Peltigera membranacea cyanobiont' 232]
MSDINWGLIRSGYTFQDLICSLILLEDHEARVYVRSGKDYAQDARSGDGRIIYQMKFHRDEAFSLAIRDAKKEAKNIAKYLATPGKSQEIWQGVQEWILISNVAFNPGDEQKWIKDVKPLFDALALKISYWTKSEIETRLHKYPDLKQAYFGGETRVFLGIAEAHEQVRSQGFDHPHALDTHYQGRKTELEQYKNFITDVKKKILVIHGAGGIGKTRFLLEGAKTQALPEGWQVLWANVATMTTTSSWFMGIIAEHPTLLLIDEPDDATVLKTLVEQISGGRARSWKVAIAVRSPNDLVLKYLQGTRMGQIVEELPLEPLEESAAVAFCQELLEFGSLQTKTANWKMETATRIAQYYDYPIWMAIATKLLESKGNLETIPQEVEGLASEYLKEIITQQQSIPSEQILNLLRWIALFDTVNREDAEVVEWIRVKVAFKNTTELQRYFDSLISRNVIFERGARNRLLKIKPDVLADYILQNWLIYKTRYGDNEPSSEALEIVTEVSEILKNSAEVSNIQKLLLRSLARFELNQQLYTNPVNILGTLIVNWCEQVSAMNAREKLGYLSLLNEISFAHVSNVLTLLRQILASNSESEIVSTIFGQRIITHDDLILALPRIIYDTAPYAQTSSEQMTILSLLCDLVIKERDIANRRPQGLPNDGNRAEIILPRLIKGQLEFCGGFETSALDKANDLLQNIYLQGNITQDQELLLNTLVKPLLSIEQESTSFDGRRVKIQRWTITVGQSEWRIRDSLRTKIKEILLEKKLQSTQATLLWNLLAYAHGEINRAISYSEDHTTITEDLLLEAEFSNSHSSDIRKSTVSYYNAHSEEFRTVLIQDLQWVANFLESQNVDIQELAAAREIWDWHYKFDKDPEVKKLAIQCENLFKGSELFPQYAPLIIWENYEVLGQWADEISNNLATLNNPQSIHDFVQNGVKFLGNPDQVSRLFIVASHLSTKAHQSQSVRKFVEEALQLAIETPEFQFAIRLCQGWIWTTRQNNPPATIIVLKQLLEWVNTSEKIVQLIQVIYEGTGLTITELEVGIVLEQQEHFLQTNSAVRFVGLLGGIFFSSLEQIKNTVETTLNKLDRKQLPSALSAFLQSLDYAMRSLTKNVEQAINHSLKNWILNLVLRLPDIDDLGGTSVHHVQDFLKMLGKPDLEWLVSTVEKRIQMVSEPDGSNIRVLPSRQRLSQWIDPISSEQAGDITIRNFITKLLSYTDSSPMLLYGFPRYLVDVDPTGIITADLVVEKLTDARIRENPRKIYQWSKFAGYYPDDSPAWRKIAHEACSLAVRFDDRHKYSIFHALKNSEPKMSISTIGEVPANFQMAVETAQQRLEAETDSILIPFREWMLQSAQAELTSEIERVKEEIEE